MGKYFGTDGFRGEANCTLTADHNSGSITCTNTLKNDRWLNGFSDVIANIFGIRH